MRFRPQHLILLAAALAAAWALGPSLVSKPTHHGRLGSFLYSAQSPGPADSTGILTVADSEVRP